MCLKVLFSHVKLGNNIEQHMYSPDVTSLSFSKNGQNSILMGPKFQKNSKCENPTKIQKRKHFVDKPTDELPKCHANH